MTHSNLPLHEDRDLPPVFSASAFSTPELAPPKVDYVKRTKVDQLDELDQEEPDEPYVFELRGQQFSMISPKDADWIDLTSAAENPRLLIHVLMPEADRMKFLALGNVRMRVLEGIVQRYQKRFGLGTSGESDGSARS